MVDKTGASGKKGGKGGSGQSRAAVEAQNTLQSRATARVIDIISHGECVGLANRANPLRSIFYDGLPIENSDGTTNWQGVEVQERRGLPSQDPFVGFNEVEEEQVANVEVTTLTPRTIRVTDNTTDALRIKMRIPSLTKQNKDNGDLNGTQVAYKIESRVVGGSWAVIANEYLNDKCTTPQELSYRIEKPETAVGDADWEVKVTRLTPDTTDVTLQNKTFLASATKLIDAKLRYSDFAAVASLADSKQFGDSIPARSFDFVGMVLDVPSNYIAPDYDNPNDQSRRQYVGLWDGTFKRAWTDNPAWILWGLLTDKDWGLGRMIKPSQVDKWELYQIALYCDQFVSDGYGGFEPRYTINTQITKQDSAYGMLQAIASTFRGMLFWSSGSVSFVADQPKDPIKLVSPANVIDGEFSYTGTALKNRHSVVRVSWNDPSDTFKQAIEVVEDRDMIDRYGYKTADITAYGCTSRAQAIRMGRWFLDTERYETETVTYRASFDHADVRPGQIIEIYDPHYAGVRMGGRITAVTNTSVTLDAPVELESGQTYSISLVRADGSLVTKPVTTTSTPSTSTLSWSGSLSTLPATGSAVIFSTALPTQRSTVVTANGSNVTLENDITFNPAYSYYIGFTLPDGTITNRQITQASINASVTTNGKSRSFTLTTPLGTLPAVDSTAFVYVPSEGFTQRSVTSHTPTSATINSSYTIKAGYDYEVMLSFSDGSVVYRKLTNAASSTTSLTWSEPTASLPVVGSMWGLTATNLAPRQFRVLNVKEVDQHLFEVTGLNYDQNKYDRIESGIVIEPSPDTIYTSTKIPNPPKNLQAYRRPVTIDGVLREKIYIFWDSSDSEFVTHYKIQVRKDDGELFDIPNSYSPSAELESRGSGDYTFVVRAVNIANKESTGLISTLSLVDERPLGDPVITNLTVEGKPVSNTQWTGSDLKVTWEVMAPSNWWNPGVAWEDPYLKDYEVTVKNAGGTILGKFYTTEKAFTLGKERSTEINGGVPLRVANISVAMRDVKEVIYGSVSKTFSNPSPLAPTQVVLAQTAATVTITVPKCPDLDYSSTKVWISTTNNFNPVVTTPTYDAPQTQFAFSATPNTTYYVRVAYTDDFSSSAADLNISTQYSVDAAGIGTGDIDTTPPAVPTGLALSSNVTIDPTTGDSIVRLVATWTTNGEVDIGTYETELTASGGFPVVEVAANNRKEWIAIGNTTYSVRLRAVDRVGNRSAFTNSISHTTIKDTGAPAAPTNISAKALFSSVALAWTNASAADLRSVRIYENSTNNSGTATLVNTVDSRPSSAGYYVRDDVAPGVTKYYWLVSVDGSGNASGFSSSVTATANGIGKVDFTPGIVAIETVASLPTSGNTKDRTVRYNDKLYTWTSSTVSTGTQYWKTGVDSTDISGSITSDQIASLDALKLAGQVQNGQIADLAATKITGQLSSSQIADLAANKITGQLANSQIADLAAAKLTGTITETQISDSAISTPKIAAGAVIAGKLAANSVAADNVIANSIGAKHLIVTDWTNLVSNGDFSSSDLSMFSIQSGSTLTYVSTGGYAGNAFISFTKPNLTDSKTFTHQNTKAIRVAEGEVLYGEWVYKGNAAASNGAYFRLEWLNEDYSAIATSPNYTDISPNEAITTSWRVAGKQVTVPIGAKWARVRVYNHNTNTTASTLDIGYLSVRRANSGKLIVDGSITANLIAAQSITGSKLFVGDTSNIFPDPDLVDINVWESETTGTPAISGTSVAQGSKNLVHFGANAPSTTIIRSKPVQVLAGAIYNVSAALSFQGTAATTARGDFGIEWYSASSTGELTWISSAPVGWDVSTQSPTRFQTNLTAPANARAARLYVQRSGGSSDPRLNLMGPVIRRAASGELIVDGAITASKILAGTITGDKIAANTITTSKLYVGDTTNVFPDANQSETSMWSLNTASDAYQYRHNSAYASDFVWRIPAGASTKTMYSPLTIVDPDREYFMSIVAALTGGSGGAARVTFDWYYYEPQSGNLTYVGGGTIANNATATQSRFGGIWKVPANANRMRLLYTRDGGGTSDAIFIEPIIRRAASGELIVDGAITANKIQAGTITGDRIQAGTISTSLLAAQAITVDKLAVTSMDNLIANGMFQSDVQGNFPGAWSRNSNGGGSGAVQVVKGGAAWPVPAAVRLRRNTASSAELSAVADRYAYEDAGFYEKGGFLAAPGDEFYVESYVYSDAANIARIEALGKTVTGAFTSEFTLQDLAFSSVNQNTVNINTSGWVKSVWTFRYNGAMTAKVALRFWNLSATATHEVYFGNILVRRRNNGQLIVDGAITTNKIFAGSVTADRIATGTITSTQIAAGTITTSNLRVVPSNIFPDPEFMELGTDLWPVVQGWYPEGAGGGNIPQNIGIRRGMILWSGAGTVSGRFHIFSRWISGLTAGQVIRIRAVGFNSSNQYMTVALHYRNSATGAEQYPSGMAWGPTVGGQTYTIQNTVPSGCDQFRIVIYNEGDNTFNGVLAIGGLDMSLAASADMLVDGTITASKIVAGTITGDRIAANTITGNQIASQSITTRNLAIGNFNNIIPDGDYRDPQWWKRGGGSGATLSRVDLPDGNWSQTGGLLFSPNDSGDVYSEFFPVEPGATYKVTFRVWKNDTVSNGFFAPFIHMPGHTWLNFKKSAAAGTVVGGNPGYDQDGSEVYFGGTDTGDQSFVMTIPSNIQKNIQFRFRQSATAGNVIFQCRIVRISDATLIADGAITTNKIQANSIDADRLRASNITVGLNVGSSGKIRLDGANNRIVISD